MINIVLIAAFVVVVAIWSGSIYLFVWVSKTSMPKKQRVLRYLAIFIKDIIFEKYPEDRQDHVTRKTEIAKYCKMVRQIRFGYYGIAIGYIFACFLSFFGDDIRAPLFMFLIILPLVLLCPLYINMFLFVSMQVEFDASMRLKPKQLFWIDKSLMGKESREDS